MPTYDSSYDNSPITRVALTDSSGQPIAGGGGGASTIADGADVTQGAIADAAVAAGAAGTLSAKLRRATQGLEDLKSLIVLAAGTNAIGKLAANSGVDIGDVDVTSVTPGTAATSLGKAADSVAGATDTGVAALMVRTDTPTTLTPADGDYARPRLNSLGGQWSQEQFAPVYEDNVNGKAVVEHRYTPSYKITADTLVKTGAGLLHSIIITCNDAAPTAGSIIFYDNTAESGSELFNHTFTTTPFAPLILSGYDVSFATGLYVGFTTTADVNVFLSYR